MVTWNGAQPIVTILAMNKGEELTVELLAASDNIVLEIPNSNELVCKQMITAPQEASD